MTDTLENLAELPGRMAPGTGVASIMVYVDFDPGSDDRIKIAVNWAT